MLRELSPWELGIWAALYQVNPWGEQRADQRAAIGHALLANANRDARKYPRPFQIREFMPYVRITDEDRNRELTEQIVSAFKALGSKDDRKDWKARRREVGVKR
jgi:hypothetical protein